MSTNGFDFNYELPEDLTHKIISFLYTPVELGLLAISGVLEKKNAHRVKALEEGKKTQLGSEGKTKMLQNLQIMARCRPLPFGYDSLTVEHGNHSVVCHGECEG